MVIERIARTLVTWPKFCELIVVLKPAQLG